MSERDPYRPPASQLTSDPAVRDKNGLAVGSLVLGFASFILPIGVLPLIAMLGSNSLIAWIIASIITVVSGGVAVAGMTLGCRCPGPRRDFTAVSGIILSILGLVEATLSAVLLYFLANAPRC